MREDGRLSGYGIIYLCVGIGLLLITLASLAGVTLLALYERDIPPALIGIGAGAAGALPGILAGLYPPRQPPAG